jgi:hypothetical protein
MKLNKIKLLNRWVVSLRVSLTIENNEIKLVPGNRLMDRSADE